MRNYVRYPSGLPVSVSLEEVVASETLYLNNISRGGLSFNSMVDLKLGTVIRLRIPPNRPVFEVLGKVAWCKKMSLQYIVGVEFINADEKARIQIIEMVFRIDEYRHKVFDQEGRDLTHQQAALEWIETCWIDFAAGTGSEAR
ncbi:MAG: PilZ domain-containing protein [Acidiferrobacterales bacterium]